MNDEIIEAVLSNPDVTFADMEALIASVSNQMGAASPWIPVLLEEYGNMVMDAYYD